MTNLLDLIPTTTPTAEPMAPWLATKLINSGHLTEGGTSRRAKIRTCRRCRTHTLTGLDQDDWGAFEAIVDPTPLNPAGELATLMAGRRTWALHHHSGRYVLDPREPGDITHHPAATRPREDVLPEHACRQPVPGPLQAPSQFRTPTGDLPANSPAPF